MSANKFPVKTPAKARFDTRLSAVQKKLFEQAARIKGYKSLSEFVIQVTQEAATTIVERHNSIVASENDKRIFFDALISPPKPNKALSKAAKIYQKQVS